MGFAGMILGVKPKKGRRKDQMSSADFDRQRDFTGTRAPSAAVAFNEKHLTAWMEKQIASFQGPLIIEQFKGGQSNPTFLLRTPHHLYVLRRKPPGNLLPSAHAVDREFRVMAALYQAGYPVAAPLALCLDETVIGSIFYVMAHVAGRVLWDPAMPGSNIDERQAVFSAMNTTLASLHCFEPAGLNLSDFGRAEAYVARQIARWSKQYVASRTSDIPEMDRLAAWLPTALPPEPPARLVHGDFRLDNLILDVDQPKILAVIDWELATLGDPLADFTYHLMQWILPPAPSGGGIASLKGIDLSALGIPHLEEYARDYAAKTGFDPLPYLDFYFAYNLFRLACILQGIAGRARDGTATSASAQTMFGQIRPLAEAGWHYAQRAGA